MKTDREGKKEVQKVDRDSVVEKTSSRLFLGKSKREKRGRGKEKRAHRSESGTIPRSPEIDGARKKGGITRREDPDQFEQPTKGKACLKKTWWG